MASKNIAEQSAAQRIRSYLSIAIVPNGTAVLIAIILALLLLVLSSTTLAALPATVANIWLVSNMVPVQGGGITVGLLPMSPAILLMVAVARRIRRNVKETVSLRTLGGIVAVSLGLPLLLTLTAAAMLLDASQVFDVSPPNIFAAIARTFAVHLIAVIFGMGPRLWRALSKHVGVSPAWVDSAVHVLGFGARLLFLGLGAALISLALHYQAVAESLQPYNPRGIAAVVLLCVLYLPNVAVAGLAMLLGADFQIQDLSISLFDAQLPILPPVPWFAALPQSHAAWMPLLMAIPAAFIFRHAMSSLTSWKQLALNTATLVLAALLTTAFTGGALGYFGTVGPSLWLSALLIMAWYAGIGAVTVAVVSYISRETVVEPEIVEDVEPEETEVEVDPQEEEPVAEVLEGEVIESEQAPEEPEATQEEDEAEDVEKLEKDSEEQ
ncbi:hypothetical protein CGERO_03460 [Corynebacterium gerontici]|uniref:Uncharacterized protein n=1 Tax=Corynebacterium gerontici TaxID=2079234 RepID=A0A3G6IYZ5_9CORY|nr:hypothetical protein CGERO_03460 [Corynebacterium gerontici]